jgi:hypothetical protein
MLCIQCHVYGTSQKEIKELLLGHVVARVCLLDGERPTSTALLSFQLVWPKQPRPFEKVIRYDQILRENIGDI